MNSRINNKVTGNHRLSALWRKSGRTNSTSAQKYLIKAAIEPSHGEPRSLETSALTAELRRLAESEIYV